MKIILSTDNTGKLHEIQELLKDLPFDVISKSEAGFGNVTVDETGDTLEENAALKVASIQLPDSIILGDDTGLFVEALGGAPGVHSARYSGEEHDDKKNRRKLLHELKDEENRKAYFKTVIAVKQEDSITFQEGICEGVILSEERGKNGFGYDSIFIPDGYDITFAEMTDAEKNQISHRSIALQKVKSFLSKI